MKWLRGRKTKRVEIDYRVINVGDDDFESQVIRRSYKRPVMVDFWAAWCAPCRQLGPVLEKLAERPDSDFTLAKVDTETYPRMSKKYQIRSIPAVKLFRNGRVVGEFTGVLPEQNIRNFVDKARAAAAPAMKSKGRGSASDRLKLARQHLKRGRGFEAHLLLDELTSGPQGATAEQLKPLARFQWDMADGDGLTGLAALDELYIDAAEALADPAPGDALAALATALPLGDPPEQARTRATMQALIALVGAESPLAQQYAPQLAA